MNDDMNHVLHGPDQRPDLEELLGAYALDATETDERSLIAEYLEINTAARREVDDLREAAAYLALIHSEREPAPASLWSNIQAEIAASAASSDSAQAFTEADDAATAKNVVSLETRRASGASTRRTSGRSVPLRIAMAVAAIAAAISAVVVLTVAKTSSSDPSMSASYSRTVRDGREIALLSAADKSTMANVALGKDGTSYLKNATLHVLPEGKVYQLWVIAPGRSEPISAGILGREVHYASFNFVGTIGAVALSIENMPGAVSPTTPIAVGSA